VENEPKLLQGTEVITKLDVAHKAPQSLQPPLAFMPKASSMKSQRKRLSLRAEKTGVPKKMIGTLT